MPVEQITNTSQSNATSLVKKDDLDKAAFLNLLTTQLKYQDPLNPMENTEFVAQLSQFSSLEQLWNINSSIQNNSLLTQAMHNSTISSLIGKEILAAGNALNLTDDGDTAFSYKLESEAEVTVKIYNEAGDIVQEMQLGKQQAGLNNESWDGTNLFGSKMSAGQYFVQVSAKQGDGTESVLDTYVEGTVSSVRFVDGQTIVMIGNAQVYPNEIIEIRTP